MDPEYQVIAEFGCGINITLLSLMTPFAVEKKDQGTHQSSFIPD